MTRPTGLVFIAQSADGYIARRDGGIRLFPGAIPERRLQLVRSKPYPSGLVQTTWRVRRGS